MIFYYLLLLFGSQNKKTNEFLSPFSKFDLLNYSLASNNVLRYDYSKENDFFIFYTFNPRKARYERCYIDDAPDEYFATLEEFDIIIRLNLKSTTVENEENIHEKILSELDQRSQSYIEFVLDLFDKKEKKYFSVEEYILSNKEDYNKEEYYLNLRKNLCEYRINKENFMYIRNKLSIHYVNIMHNNGILEKIQNEFSIEKVYEFLSEENNPKELVKQLF